MLHDGPAIVSPPAATIRAAEVSSAPHDRQDGKLVGVRVASAVFALRLGSRVSTEFHRSAASRAWCSTIWHENIISNPSCCVLARVR